jgi:hypothetical protein
LEKRTADYNIHTFNTVSCLSKEGLLLLLRGEILSGKWQSGISIPSLLEIDLKTVNKTVVKQHGLYVIH